jgi:hypothetical protein
MKRNEVILTAAFIAITIHLVVAIVFMVLKISSLHNDMVGAVEVSLQEEVEPPPEPEKPKVMTPDEFLENASVDQLVNVIKNLADKPVDIDPVEYQEMVKNELIESGQLGSSNYIDEQKRVDEASKEEITVNDQDQKPVEIKKKKELDKNITFQSPTRIYYMLEKRHHTYLPIPIYKCEGAGQITLSIEVDQHGNVLKATPASEMQNTTDECLIETAETYALRAIFNADPDAPAIQTGFLTFVFVSQRKR